MTPASSTPPSDAEVIADALKAAERESWDGDKNYAFLLHQLATRLKAANAIIESFQSSASKAALPKPSAEVAGMVKRLRDKAKASLGWRTYLNQAPTEHDEEELFLLSVAALVARAQTPPGWKLVPVEPSREMWPPWATQLSATSSGITTRLPSKSGRPRWLPHQARRTRHDRP